MQNLTSEYPREYIYKKTGIQFMELNTLYQLYVEERDLLERAEKILLIPDYIGYVLTGLRWQKQQIHRLHKCLTCENNYLIRIYFRI